MEVTKEVLGIVEFKNLCAEMGHCAFIFDTQNQRGSLENFHMSTNVKYSNVIVMMNPNRVCFRGDKAVTCLDGVKGVTYTDYGEIGGLLEFRCGDGTAFKDCDEFYTMLVSKN